MDRFEELEVFQRAYRISLEIHHFSHTLPTREQRDLGDQMRRASKSICANLAEGFGKQGQSRAEFRRFVQMAIGSANEMRIWLRYCLDLSYLEESRWQAWRIEYEEIAKMMQSLSNHLGKRLGTSKSSNP